MHTTIGAYDHEKRTVPVTFAHAGVSHVRDVNACHDEDDRYNDEATAARVADVARGVAVKIELGVIREAEPEPVVPPAPADRLAAD